MVRIWSVMAENCTERSVQADVSAVSRGRRRLLVAGVAGSLGLGIGHSHMAVAAAGAGSTPLDLASAEREAAARRGELCSTRNPVGVGLRGDYYPLADLQGRRLLSRTDPVVDFDASLAWPTDRRAHRPRSARWSGWVKPPLDGAYRFHLALPGARIEVARQLALADGRTEAVSLERGRFAPITVVAPHLPVGGPFRIALEWTAPHGARYVVPTALLHLPSDSARGAS